MPTCHELGEVRPAHPRPKQVWVESGKIYFSALIVCFRTAYRLPVKDTGAKTRLAPSDAHSPHTTTKLLEKNRLSAQKRFGKTASRVI
jgi:hypothetical protein